MPAAKSGYKVSVSPKAIEIANAVLSYDRAAERQERGQAQRFDTHGVTTRMIGRLERGTYSELSTLRRDVSNIRQMIAATDGEHSNPVVPTSEAGGVLQELWGLEQGLETNPAQFEQAPGGRVASKPSRRVPAR